MDGAAAGQLRSPNCDPGRRSVLAAIETVPSRAGIEFIDEYGGGPSVRFRKGHHKED